MLVYSSKISIEWIMRFEIAQIWGNLIQITRLFHKEFLLETRLLLFVGLLFSAMVINISERFLG